MTLKRTGILMPLAVIAILGVTAEISGQTTVTLPYLVVKDGNSNVLGPVISVSDNNRPVVALTDPTAGGRKIFLRVDKKGFRTIQFTVKYSGAGCTGNVYLLAPSTRFGVDRISGIGYGVGPGAGGDIFIYRTDEAAPLVSQPSIQSQYSAPNPDFSNAGLCSATTSAGNLVGASDVINVSTLHPPDYTVE